MAVRDRIHHGWNWVQGRLGTIGFLLLAIGIVWGLHASYSNDQDLKRTQEQQHQVQIRLDQAVNDLERLQRQLDQEVIRNCKAVEEINAVSREEAQATIDGDKALLADHRLNGTPLPVPEVAVLGDIAAKQRKIDRLAPRKCE